MKYLPGVTIPLAIIFGIISILCLYALYRNHKVYEFRISLIGSPLYEELPSYDTMFYKFWVWPMERFLLKKHRRKIEII